MACLQGTDERHANTFTSEPTAANPIVRMRLIRSTALLHCTTLLVLPCAVHTHMRCSTNESCIIAESCYDPSRLVLNFKAESQSKRVMADQLSFSYMHLFKKYSRMLDCLDASRNGVGLALVDFSVLGATSL